MGTLSLVEAMVEFGGYNSSLVQQTLGPGGWERVIVYPLVIWDVAHGSYLSTEGASCS